MTKAAISAQPGKTTVRVPYKELLASIGRETSKEVDLVITIELKWDEPIKQSE